MKSYYAFKSISLTLINQFLIIKDNLYLIFELIRNKNP